MTPVIKLSGGEKRRLQLLRVLINAPNFLILDEPTNDLDILTMNVLEEYLLNFEGTLIIVSHDRYFMDKLTNHLFVFKGIGNIIDFPGNYSDYKKFLDKNGKKSSSENIKESKNKKNTKAEKTQKRRLGYNEKKELERLENEITDLESKKEELINKLNSGTGNHEKLTQWSLEIEQIATLIDEKEMRWLELSEYA